MKKMEIKNDKEIIEFNRSKIYEKLEFIPAPKDFHSKIPWTVQLQIAATNGIHYVDTVGKLFDYPKYELPVPPVTGDKLMLDIGCGWGRWLNAGAAKGYIPIGADIRLEFCQTARKVLMDQEINGYTIVADLENLPFQDSIFDFIWSFSVIQHTHQERMLNCLKHINRILNANGFTRLEFPNKNGFRNSVGPVKKSAKTKDDYNSWAVRYYTPNEYKTFFKFHLDDFNYAVHSFLGIGVLKEDIKYVTFKNKVLCAISLLLTGISKIIPGMESIADSLYITAKKKQMPASPESNAALFFSAHHNNPSDNLNLVHLLKCPKYGSSLQLSNDRKKIFSIETGIYYPVENDIPILISSESKSL